MTPLSRAEVGSHSIAYRRAGCGTPLVLLHGFLCDSRVWEPQLTALADQFTVVAWDAPGAGASSDPRDPFTMTDWAHCLAGFLEVIGVDRAHVLGLSWGGVLAQEFYRVYPSRVMTLILADTYAGWKGSLSPAVCEQRLAKCHADSVLPRAEFVRQWVPGQFFTAAVSRQVQEQMAAIVADFQPHGFRLMAKSLAETDTTVVLSTIQVPTLILCGDDDQRSPTNIAEQLRDGTPGAELAIIPHAGHVSNMEQPEAFNAHIRRFCGARVPIG